MKIFFCFYVYHVKHEYIYSRPLGKIRGERSVCFSIEIYLPQGILLNNLSFPHYLEIPPLSHVFCGNGFCFTELPALLGASSEQRVPAQSDRSRGKRPGSGLPSCTDFVTSDSYVVFFYPSFVICKLGLCPHYFAGLWGFRGHTCKAFRAAASTCRALGKE